MLLLGIGQIRAGMGWARPCLWWWGPRGGGQGRWGRSLLGLVLRGRIRGLSQRLLRCVRVETCRRFVGDVFGLAELKLSQWPVGRGYHVP